MSERYRDLAAQGITRIENELLVRDFLDVLNLRDLHGLDPFLHSDVRFNGSSSSEAVGKPAVLHVCAQVFDNFPVFEVQTLVMTSVDRFVLVEEAVRAAPEDGCNPVVLMGFASFEIVDYQIVNWRQLHG
jgi:limonene-1,2-epoxide hydrolase